MTYLAAPINRFNQANRYLNRYLGDQPLNEAHLLEPNHWKPHADINESNDAFRVLIDIPGVKTNDVDISLHEGVLTIRGERVAPEAGEEKSVRVERNYGSFVRQFSLPNSVLAEAVSAKAADGDGVLEITIPKAKKPEPIRITVQV